MVLSMMPLTFVFCAYGLLSFMLAARMLTYWPESDVAQWWHEVCCTCRTIFALAAVPLIFVGVIGWFL